MDISDRIESRDPLAIPEHLIFAFEEWIAELIRQACDDDSPETRDAVIKAVHFHDAFAARSLSPVQLAELAEGAAGWMEPKKLFQNERARLSVAGSWMPGSMRAVRRAGGPAIRAHRHRRRETVR